MSQLSKHLEALFRQVQKTKSFIQTSSKNKKLYSDKFKEQKLFSDKFKKQKALFRQIQVSILSEFLFTLL